MMETAVIGEDRMMSMSVALPQEVRQVLGRMAREQKRSVSFLIREAVAEFVERHGQVERLGP